MKIKTINLSNDFKYGVILSKFLIDMMWNLRKSEEIEKEGKDGIHIEQESKELVTKSISQLLKVFFSFINFK